MREFLILQLLKKFWKFCNFLGNFLKKTIWCFNTLHLRKLFVLASTDSERCLLPKYPASRLPSWTDALVLNLLLKIGYALNKTANLIDMATQHIIDKNFWPAG